MEISNTKPYEITTRIMKIEFSKFLGFFKMGTAGMKFPTNLIMTTLRIQINEET